MARIVTGTYRTHGWSAWVPFSPMWDSRDRWWKVSGIAVGIAGRMAYVCVVDE